MDYSFYHFKYVNFIIYNIINLNKKGAFKYIMKSYIIEGGKRLEGEVEVSGSKNAALPIIAATILNGGVTKLYNIPNIYDTKITLDILNYLGCKIKKNKKYIEIDSKNISITEIPEYLMIKMRSSVVIAGALIR